MGGGGGGEERGKKRGGKISTAGLEPATFHSTANCLQLPPEVESARSNVLNRRISIVMRVASLAALAPPIIIQWNPS